MKYGKRLYILKVQLYIGYLCKCIIGLSLGGSSLFYVITNIGSGSNERSSLSNLTEVTYKICTFITVRLSVFTLAVLLMGHLLLPKKTERKGRNTINKEEEKKKKEEMVTFNNNGKGGSRKNHTRASSSQLSSSSWSVSFLLATFTIIIICCCTGRVSATSSPRSISSTRHNNLFKKQSTILVAGSLNVDTFLPIHRFPSSGENLTLLPNLQPLVDVPGG